MRTCAIAAMLVACGGEGKPLTRDRAVDPGAALFNGYAHAGVKCYECHDGDGRGTKWGPALAQRVPKLSAVQLRETIVRGKGKMPSYRDKLSDAELDVLVAWLQREFHGVAATPQPKPKPTPTPVYAAPTDDPCERDDQCIVTNFAGCCACPQCSSEPPYAVTQDQLAREEAVCHRVDCAPNPACDVGGMCPPGEPVERFVARCRDRHCVAVHR